MTYIYKIVVGEDKLNEMLDRMHRPRVRWMETIGQSDDMTIHLHYAFIGGRYQATYICYMPHSSGTYYNVSVLLDDAIKELHSMEDAR